MGRRQPKAKRKEQLKGKEGQRGFVTPFQRFSPFQFLRALFTRPAQQASGAGATRHACPSSWRGGGVRSGAGTRPGCAARCKGQQAQPKQAGIFASSTREGKYGQSNAA